MKILFLLTRGRKYFSQDVLTDFSFSEEFLKKDGANRLTLGALILDKLNSHIDLVNPKLSETNINYAKLEEFDQKCKEADRIFLLTPLPVNSFVNKLEAIYYSNIAFKYMDKVRMIIDDPMDLPNFKKSLSVPKTFYNDFNIKRFHGDIDAVKKYLENINYAYYNCKKLLNVLYKHSEDEIKECYGDIANTIYLAHALDTYIHFEKNETPISERSNELKYAALSPQRQLENNKKFLKYFNIKEVNFIGVKQYKNLSKPEALSEKEIYSELYNSKFILSLPTRHKSLSWERRRIVFAMLLNAVLIPFDDEARYLGKPFILPPDILSKSDEELQDIANAQHDYFYSHVLTKDDVKNNIKKWIV